MAADGSLRHQSTSSNLREDQTNLHSPHQRQFLTTSNARLASFLTCNPKTPFDLQRLSTLASQALEGLKRDRRDGRTHHGASHPRRARPLVQGTALQFHESFQGRFSNLAAIPNILQKAQGIFPSRVHQKSSHSSASSTLLSAIYKNMQPSDTRP